MVAAEAIAAERAFTAVVEADRIAEILAIAREAAIADSEVPPRRSDVVWYAMREAFDTLNRLPDRETGWLYCMRSAFPEYVHDYRERLELYEEALQRLRLGENLMPEVRTPPPSARAISRMDYVFGWHRFLRDESKKRRDWKIICLLASGRRAVQVARMVRCSRDTVYDRREIQTISIAHGLEATYGGVFEAR